MYDVLVVGAGFAGVVFAREMADAEKTVLIVEKRSQIGW
jgi:UDP-galactopyranose mutase